MLGIGCDNTEHKLSYENVEGPVTKIISRSARIARVGSMSGYCHDVDEV